MARVVPGARYQGFSPLGATSSQYEPVLLGDRMQDGVLRPCPAHYRQTGLIHLTWPTIPLGSTFLRHKLRETARRVALVLRSCESSPETVTNVTISAGRRRVYATNADRQRAYRARLKARRQPHA